MKSILLAILFSCCFFFGQAQFTAGNIVIEQLGDGSTALSGTATTVKLLQFSPAGISQNGTPFFGSTGTPSTSPFNVVESGSATSNGYLSLSVDKTFIVVPGYNAPSGTASIAGTSSATYGRTIGKALPNGTLQANGTFNTLTGNNYRSVVSTGAAYWLAGATGVVYTASDVTTNLTTTAISIGSVNTRILNIFNNTLLYSTSSGTAGIYYLGTFNNLPTAASTATLVFAPPSGSPYGFSFSPNGLVCYVADDRVVTSSGGIQKWSYSGSFSTTTGWSGGSWSLSYILGTGGTAGARGITVDFAGTNPIIYATTAEASLNRVIKITDIGAASTATTFTTAGSNFIFRGIAFAPETPPTPSATANPSSISFSNTVVGSFSTGQAVSLTASNLTPATGSLAVLAPSTNFQVSNDNSTWVDSTNIAYSGSGSTIANFYVRFTPQSASAKSGNVTIKGGGLSTAVNVPVSGTGDNNLTFTTSSATTTAIHPPYVSGTINDPNDPTLVSGILLDVKQSGTIIPAANYTISVVSSNTSVVPTANVGVTKADGLATVKINPAAVGYATITLTLSNGTDTKDYVINYAASQSPTSTTNWLTGISNASTAIALDDNYMVIGDDETNLLYLYNRKQPGLPVKTFDYNQGNILGLTDGAPAYKEVDVEASAKGIANPSRMYWLGSMSNSSSFNNKPNRNRLFAVDASGTGAATTFTNAGNYANLRQQLITWGDNNGYGFTASAAEGVDPKTINGFNIEGMAFGPDNTTMYIGFRAPLVPTANRNKAVIAPIQNFESWFNNGSPASNPTIGSPIELNLGNRGIRELYRLSNGVFVIVAGSCDGTLNPAIYTWSGVATDAPVLQSSFNVAGLNAEAVLGVNENGQLSANKLQLICDNGSTVFYGDGVEAKDLTQANFTKFSSDIVVSPSTILPIQLQYFTATKNNADVLLNWQTAVGDDGVTFDILRSANGQDFATIQTVAAVANKNTYAFTDFNVPISKLYYRIATKSADGQKLFSAIRVVDAVGQSPIVRIYPNPVTNNIFSVETSSVGNKKLGIYNSEGVLFKYYEYAGTVKDIPTNNWPRGTYLLRIMSSDGKELPVQKIVVL